MHLAHFVLISLLSSLVACDQAPLKEKASGWLDKAKSYLPSGAPSKATDTGSAPVVEKKVEKINIRNWQRKLAPKLDGEEEWIIYLTGGNKSCYGRCGPVDVVWNVWSRRHPLSSTPQGR